MKIKLLREKETEKSTMGRLIATAPNGETIEVYSLELPWRDNKPNMSCITPDVYKARIEYHQHFKQEVVRLENKHGRTGILIHQGNWPSQIEGCILPGLTAEKDAVYQSVAALKKLTEFCKTHVADTLVFGSLEVLVETEA